MELKDFIAKYGGDWEIKDINQFMNILRPKPKTIWDLENGDRYWCVDDCGYITFETWRNSCLDKKCRLQGNAFLTKEEAEYEVKRREVYTIVKKYSHEYTREEWENYDVKKCYPFYRFDTNRIDIIADTMFKMAKLYFESLNDIQKAIDEVGEDDFIKYYLGVKDYDEN